MLGMSEVDYQCQKFSVKSDHLKVNYKLHDCSRRTILSLIFRKLFCVIDHDLVFITSHRSSKNARFSLQGA